MSERALPDDVYVYAFGDAADVVDNGFDAVTGSEHLDEWAEGTEPSLSLKDLSTPDSELAEIAFEARLRDSLLLPMVVCRPARAHRPLPERVQACDHVAQVQAAFFMRSDASHPNQAAVHQCTELLEKRDSLKPEGWRWRRVNAQLEQSVTEVLLDLARVNERIPLRWLRGLFLLAPLSDEVIASYLDFTIETSARPDRVERMILVALKSASYPLPDGTLRLRRTKEVTAAWNETLPEVNVDLEQVQQGVRFFRDASARLREFSDHANLFSSTFYFEVIGYISALKEQLCKPALLMACCDFYIHLLNWIEVHAKAAVTTGAVEKGLIKSFDRVSEILQAEIPVVDPDEDDFFARFLRACREAGPGLRGNEPKQKRPKSQLRQRFRIVAGAVVLAGFLLVTLPMIQEAVAAEGRDLDSMSAGETQALHPLLASAKRGKDTASLVVARVTEPAWQGLSTDERTRVGSELTAAAAKLSFRNLVVFVGETIVLEVSDGRVIYVERRRSE